MISFGDVERVSSRTDFLSFLESLAQDLKNNGEHWENANLSDFLEALGAWVDDMDGYYLNNNRPIPEEVSWGIFASMLFAARNYE